jgi:hypothetical protein
VEGHLPEIVVMSRMRPSFVLVLAGLLAACSSVPYAQRQQQRLAAYEAAAGAPVRHFSFFSPLWSWEPLDDSQLVVYTKPRQAWLLDLGATCQNLMFTSAIGLTSNLNQVSVNFDKVITGRGDFPCTIKRIRPVDVARLKIEQEKQRKVETRPRSGPAGDR